jgi:hypothetical protein
MHEPYSCRQWQTSSSIRQIICPKYSGRSPGITIFGTNPSKDWISSAEISTNSTLYSWVYKSLTIEEITEDYLEKVLSFFVNFSRKICLLELNLKKIAVAYFSTTSW